MPSFTGKTFSSFYANILSIDQASNIGIDTVVRGVMDGVGNSSALQISDDQVRIRPQNDDGTLSVSMQTSGGDNVLTVDTTNKKVLVGAEQVAANTQYQTFGANSVDYSALSANTHYAVPFIGGGDTSKNDVDFGTGTDPATSFTTADTDTQFASQLVPMMWILDDAITIDAVTSIEGADAATGDTTRMHLFSYTFNSGGTSALTSGTLLAHNSDVTNAGNEQVYKSTWTVDSANVAANKAILCFFRSDSVNSDYSLSIRVKYHIQ